MRGSWQPFSCSEGLGGGEGDGWGSAGLAAGHRGRGVNRDSRRGEQRGHGGSGKVILGMPVALPSGEGGCQMSFSGGYG